ncbi:GNAT family N-acetyltransferase [Vallitalea sp.]|jgi:RimJ/RimL family protein N-acetyltransferase|uniref:GNAT family N-acetyltransferase n=1 Tax=Vallitalea sp. TaxID=1882829 RepID=UPI0025FFC118|nr:GNAT family N-acetyltransferase [Vallitalea sp.]MCT4686030.1 GNAT family N-acetyltransferase [Vallitalea sp.]
MKITFEEIDKKQIEPFEYIAKWSNDPEIKYFIGANLTEGEMPDREPKELFKNAGGNDKHIYLIKDGTKPIGDLSIMIDPPHVKKKEKNTGWISICIGEKEYRGKGVALKAMDFLEEECRMLGMKRIELGVFEYNKRARAFYEKIGYEEFARVKNFVYYEGKWREDIRMEKYL